MNQSESSGATRERLGSAARMSVWICGLALATAACSTAPPPVDLKTELEPRHPAWRPLPVGVQDDGKLVLGGVAGPAVVGVIAAGTCAEPPSGDWWLFPGNPEVALTVGWGDAPASLVHAPRPGCVATVALLPGGIPGGMDPSFERREVFDTCVSGDKGAPSFQGSAGDAAVTFGVEGFAIAGLPVPGTVAASGPWHAEMCGSGTVGIAFYETDRGRFVRFSVQADQSAEVANQQIVESTEVRLTAAGPVILSRTWSLTSSWGEEGESEEVEVGEASLGWVWGETVVLRTEGFRSEKSMDRDCEVWSLAEYGSWTLNQVLLDQYDELDGGETRGCSQESDEADEAVDPDDDEVGGSDLPAGTHDPVPENDPGPE
jgi:hypothetical protein